MKKKYLLCTIVAATVAMYSCHKNESPSISTPQFQSGQVVKYDTLSGTVKGTLVAGKTYYFATPITINAGDTLVLQSGVKLLSLNPAAQLIVNGSFISLGTKDAPNWITGVDAYSNPAKYKLTTPTDPNSDPALIPSGKLWSGIVGTKTTSQINIKWTHLDFAGGTAGTNNVQFGYKAADLLYVILFQNDQGYLILEDSWIYGSSTDVTRILGGNIHILRNTVEKLSYNDGDAFNAKNSTIGDMAYNLIVGTAKGGTKSSNKGSYGTGRQTNVTMYNNTYISGGWRSVDPDRGANVDIEEGARGLAYNNIMVNCKTGLRILENPAADTSHCSYGNNLTYGDTVAVVNAIYPPTHASHAQASDIPNPATFYPNYPNYKLGQVYNANTLVGLNNPKFVNYPLPLSTSHISEYNYIGTYDFHLSTGSPAIGAGNTGFSPINATSAISNSFLKATVTPPNKDLGAYPTDGTGNQHTVNNSQQ